LPDRKVHTAILFENGEVAVCDECGEQIPELQGRYKNVRDAVIAGSGPTTTLVGNWTPEDRAAAGSRPFGNLRVVGLKGELVVILNPINVMSREQALNLAVWLTAVAGFNYTDFYRQFTQEIG
jgi:hypothetical protein